MIIFQTKYQDASYEGDKALFVSEWKSSSEEMDDETYKKEINAQFDFIRQNKVNRILFITENFNFIITPDVQEWNNELLVREFDNAGVLKVAFVVPPYIFAQVAIEQTMTENSVVSFETEYFKDEESARAWLM